MKLPGNIPLPLVFVPLLAALSLVLLGTMLLNVPATPTDAAPPESVPPAANKQYFAGTPTPRPNPAPALHGADIWQDFSVTGFKGQSTTSRVRVAVIDVGFDDLTISLLHKGFDTSNLSIYCWDEDKEIFNETVITHCGGSDHGTKVVEALLDIAPDIELYIVEVPNDRRLYMATDWLRRQHLDVVVMSLSWGLNAEGDGDPAFTEDSMSSIEKVVKNRETVWINSGGNNGLNNWSGTWQTRSVGASTRIKMGPATSLNGISIEEGSTVTARLRWDDEFPGSYSGAGADCDLNLVSMRPSHHVAEPPGGKHTQDGGSFQNPYEEMTFVAPQDGDSKLTEKFKYYFYIEVVDCPGTKPRWIQLQVTESTDTATLDYPSRAGRDLDDAHPNYRQIGVPAELDSTKFLAVGASNTTGTDIMSFSSRGPRSDEVTAELPHLAASACLHTWVDPEESCGTSFAAPHVAGLAALVKSKYPSKTASSIVNYLKNRALDRTDASLSDEGDPNNRWGEGLALLPGAQLLDSATSDPVLSDGNTRIELNRFRTRDYGINTSLPGADRVTVSIDGNGLSLSNSCLSPLRSKIVRDGDTISIKACQFGEEKVRLSDRLRNELLFTYTFDIPDNRPGISGGISSISIEVGASRAYNLATNFNGATSYSSVSSDPSVATVVHASPTMTVTAVGVGTATITTTGTNNFGSRSISFTVTVEPSAPDAPTGVTGSSPTRDSIYVNWNSVDGASKYRVQYRESPNGTWQTATSNDQEPGLRVSGLECGTSYEFRVTAFGNGTDATAEWGAYSNASDAVSTLACLPLVAAPTVTVTTPVPRGTASLTWPYQANVEKYRVRYRVDGTTSWTTSNANIAPSGDAETANSHTVTGLSCGNDYELEVTGHGDDSVTRDDWGAPTEVGGSTEACNKPMFTTDGLGLANIPDVTPVNTVLATLTVTDATTDERLTYTLSGSGSSYFAIAAQADNIRKADISVASTLQIGTYTLTAQVTDKHGQRDTATVTIEVIENLALPVSDLQRDSRTRNTLTLSWTALTGATKYRVEYRLEGDTSWTEDTDSHIAGSHTVAGLTCEADYQFRVTGYGDGTTYKAKWGIPTEPLSESAGDCEEPEFPGDYQFSVDEVEPAGTSVGTVTAVDPSDPETLGYTIIAGNTGSAFALNRGTGEITVAGTLDYATLNSYTLQVRVTDQHSQTDDALVAITVNENITPAPTGLAVSASDRDSVTLSWNPVDGAAKYVVEHKAADSSTWATATTGETTGSHSISPLPCERDYQFRVTGVGDGTTYKARRGLTATLDAPTGGCERPEFDQDPYRFNVRISEGTGASVGTLTATDPTVGETLTYSILSGNDDEKFALDASTGAITVADSLDVDPPVYTYFLSVLVRDTQGQSDAATVNITAQLDYEISFSAASQTVSETTGVATVTIQLDQIAQEDLAIDLNTGWGGTISYADYSGAPDSATIGAGLQEVSFTFTIVDDEDDDDGEVLSFGFTSLPANLTRVYPSRHLVNIEDNDGTVPPETVWSATLTVGASGGSLGYSNTSNVTRGSITDDEFTWQGADHTVSSIVYNPYSPNVFINMSGVLANRDNLTLWLDSRGFDFADTATGIWYPVTLDWSDGDTVAVKITYQAPEEDTSGS